MRKLGVLFALLGIATLSPAPIKIAPPKDAEYLPEHSQAQLEQEQKIQGVHKEVGQVPEVTDRSEVQGQNSGSEGAKTLQTAAAAQEGEAVVRKASERIQDQSGGIPAYIWAILFVALGFGSVYAFRYWIAKNVPLPGDSKHRVTW